MKINPEYVLRQKEEGWTDITPKDKALALAYIQSGYINRDAAAEMKMSPMKAVHILKRPLVEAYISDLAKDREECNIVTRHFILAQYMRMLPMTFGDEEVPVMLADGTQIEAKKFSASDTSNVLKELAKVGGVYEEQQEVVVKKFEVILTNATD